MAARSPKEELEQLKVVDLKDMLRQHKLSPTGTKAVLIQRILDNKIYPDGSKKSSSSKKVASSSKKASPASKKAPSSSKKTPPASKKVTSPAQASPSTKQPKSKFDHFREAILRYRQQRDYYIRSIIYLDSSKSESKITDSPLIQAPDLVNELDWPIPQIFPLKTYIGTHFQQPTRDLTDDEIAELEVPIPNLPSIYLQMHNVNNINGYSRDGDNSMLLLEIEAGEGKNLSWYNIFQAAQKYYNWLGEQDYGDEIYFDDIYSSQTYDGIPIFVMRFIS